MYTSPEEQKIADLRELPVQTEIELLRNNVKELQL